MEVVEVDIVSLSWFGNVPVPSGRRRESGFTADPQMAHVEYFTLVFYLAKQVLSETLSNNISTRYKSIHILCLSMERKHHKLCLQNRLQKKPQTSTYQHTSSSHRPLQWWSFPWSSSDCVSSLSSLIGWHCFWRGHWRAGGETLVSDFKTEALSNTHCLYLRAFPVMSDSQNSGKVNM